MIRNLLIRCDANGNWDSDFEFGQEEKRFEMNGICMYNIIKLFYETDAVEYERTRYDKSN